MHRRQYTVRTAFAAETDIQNLENKFVRYEKQSELSLLYNTKNRFFRNFKTDFAFRIVFSMERGEDN